MMALIYVLYLYVVLYESLLRVMIHPDKISVCFLKK